MRNPVIGLFLFGVLGCATGGSGAEEWSAPAYRTADDVPCEYEPLQALEETCTVMDPELPDGDCNERRVLGVAGARVGADAVILPEPEFPVRLPFAVRGQPVTLRFEGLAVRYLDPSCAGGVSTLVKKEMGSVVISGVENGSRWLGPFFRRGADGSAHRIVQP